MRLLEAVSIFITVLVNSFKMLAQVKTENAELRAEVNGLRVENGQLKIENAELKGENTELVSESAKAIELLETAVDLNGPADELAQIVIDNPAIETPAALENPAIGDPAVETPAEVLVEAVKAIAGSVVELDDYAIDMENFDGVERG
jgi:regulator of replication initiation timing